MTATTAVRWLTILVFVTVATAACRQALRQRDSGAWWIFASFVVIATVTIVLGVLPDESNRPIVAILRRVTLAILPLFPYFLFRFTAALTPPPAPLRVAAYGLTGLTVVAAVAVNRASLGTGESSTAYEVFLLVQWTFLSTVVAWRLWRAGTGEPSVARRRIRTLSAGAMGLTIPLLLAGAAAEGAVLSLVIRTTALASAVLFLVALAPPGPLRLRWRRDEEARLRTAVGELMSATTTEQVTATLLPHVAAVLGARGAMLRADDGAVIAAYPPDVPEIYGESTGDGSHPRVDIVRLGAGQLSVYTSPYTAMFGREELDLLATFGGLADLALQRCKDLGVAEMLQRSLLPETLPDLPGIHIEGRYLPSESGAVGGDWYDVIPLPHGRVGLAIGDVMGHGVGAAALMGHLRSALRAYALDGTPPVGVLSKLDAYLEHLALADMATVLYVVVDAAGGTAVFASAGHLAPLVRAADGSVRSITGGLGPPLGLFRTVAPADATITLPPGSTIILFTDGLVERRGENIDEGLHRLRHSAASASAVGFGDYVISQLVQTGTPDDVALLVAHLPLSGHASPARGDEFTTTLAAEARSAAVARALVRARLVDWGCSDAADVTELLTTELVANAARHTRSTTLVLDMQCREGRVSVGVTDGGASLPRPRNVDESDESGRGLHLIDALAADWGVDPRGDGKRVWFQVASDPPPGSNERTRASTPPPAAS